MNQGSAGQLFFGWVQDTWRGLERCIDRGGRQALLLAAGFALSAFVYVPVHELLHAAACLAAGGAVTTLEISPWFGGAALARALPFVRAGGDYAGRLVGFDDRGSDWIYLATVLGPYVLTVVPGVFLARAGGTKGDGFVFGAALPAALAPFVSLTGDAYEIGAIVATRLPWWSETAVRTALRGDDVFRVIPRVYDLTGGPLPWAGLATAFAIGALWACATYAAGGMVARALRYGPIPSVRRAPAAVDA